MAQESTSSEKGVYSLCQKLIGDGVAVNDLFVVFISNEVKKIPLWNRKGSVGKVVRDYHVFCIQRMKDSEDRVWDLDSEPPSPSTISSYVSQSIRPSSYKLYAELQRVFSVVHAKVFLQHVDSDWRHMKVSKENWTSPPKSPPKSEGIVAAESEVAEAFSKHFTKEEMIPLVEYNDKKIFKVKVKKLKTAIAQIPIPEEAEISEVIKTMKHHVKDAKLPEIVVVGILWDVLMDVVLLSWKNQQKGKNQQQWNDQQEGDVSTEALWLSWKNQQQGKNQQQFGDLVLRQVKTWAKLLKEFCTTEELQLELLYKVQVECCQVPWLMKLFPEIVRKLKEEDVLDEDTILLWFREGTNPEERESFVKALETFVKKIFEGRVKTAIATQKSEEAEISEVIEMVKQHVKDAKLPEIVVVRILWDVLMDVVQWSGNTQQENAELAGRQVKTWAELLIPFCTSEKLQLELLYKVQVWCYKDMDEATDPMLFLEIVRNLYDEEVLAEDTILHWFRKGTNQKGREIFVKALLPFVKEIFGVKFKEMKTAITNQVDALSESECVVDRILWDVLMDSEISIVIETVKQHVKEGILPEMVSWDVLMNAVQWSGDNQQQNAELARRQVITWGKLLIPFYTGEKLQLKLLYNVQVWCYENMGEVTDPMLFPQIVRILYDKDVLDEEIILLWFRKGTNPKGRKSFLKALEPFFKEIFEVKVMKMKTAITTEMVDLPESVVDRILWVVLMDADISIVIENVKQYVEDALLPEMVRILWDVMMDAVQWSGNQQQNDKLALRQVKTWAKLLIPFCTSKQLELYLLYKVQVKCYANTKLTNLFVKIVIILYDQDVLDEETILDWFHKGTNPRGRERFVMQLKEFVKWLEEAEEEE